MSNSLTTILVLLLVASTSTPAFSQTHTKIVDNGPDSARLVIAVIGDGYSAADQTTFQKDVDRFLSGALQHSGYSKHRKAFNVYRVNAISKESGISTPGKPKDTALHTRFVGPPCYIAESADTVPILERMLAKIRKYDFIMVLLNTAEYGGCAIDNTRLYVTSSVRTDAAAHELAHGVAKLYDEYFDPGATYAGALNDLNCSTVLDSQAVTWKTLLTPNAKLPSDGTGVEVGMYRGCNYHSDGIFRPADKCFMRQLDDVNFCPVCSNLLRHVLSQHSGQPAPPQTPGFHTGSYVDVLMRVSRDGKFEILDAKDAAGQVETAASELGDLMVEIQRDGVPVSVAALRNSAFQRRGYGPPESRQAPHNVSEAATTTLRMRIPGITLSNMNDRRLELNLYRVNREKVADLSGRVLPSSLQNLRDASALSMEWTVPPGKLRDALAQYQVKR